ncbi:MAG: hypothetical protein PHY40_01570 [Patescibacteria group bacterium]|nr:hypothetical protein [Patescibacteria group bacterium]
MTLRSYLALMLASSIICWIAWFFVIISFDPKEAGTLGFILFYAALFFALTSAFAAVGGILNEKFSRSEELPYKRIKRIFYQGAIFGVIAVLSLLFLQLKIFVWWSAILLFLLFFVLEGIVYSVLPKNQTSPKIYV